ncbi:hypothetical protein WBG78_23185 [Chryseolinea sp. T2]|uniref:hypothetical protein n=1 Tax=Chryseolinea sp. T2 TaxID=3129255 RepID=UPI00307829A4
MKNFLLNFWSLLTPKKEKSDGSGPEELSEEEIGERTRTKKQQYEEDLREKRSRDVEFVWCLVGNIIGEHPVGVDKELRAGTKHFSPGTKVYCFPPQWGDGYEKIRVIGRPRQSSRFIKVVISSSLVTNWRLQQVFKPRIKKEMIKNNGWNETDESKERILILLDSILKNRGGH